MRIGENELEIMKLLEKNNGLKKNQLRERFDPDWNKTVALSQTLKTLKEKGLIAKYAEIITETQGWRYVSKIKDEKGRNALLMEKPYEKKMDKGPPVKTYLGLTKKGRKELRKCENRLSG